MPTEFIPNAGACIVSQNILQRRGHIKWVSREPSMNPADNGWRILSDVDTDEFLSDPANMAVVDFNSMIEMEPALLGVYTMPVGSDLQLVVEQDRRRRWFDNRTGQEIVFS